MNQELYNAKKTLAQATWYWANHYESKAMEEALTVLIEALGGKSWIESHSRYRQCPPQILHAASMRTEEVIDGLPAAIHVHDVDLFFDRSDVCFLLSFPTA